MYNNDIIIYSFGSSLGVDLEFSKGTISVLVQIILGQFDLQNSVSTCKSIYFVSVLSIDPVLRNRTILKYFHIFLYFKNSNSGITHLT